MEINRCLGVYYPKKMRDERFRRRTYLLIFLSWFFAYFPFLVTMSGLYNHHGFTCYQRKCSVINLYDFELGKPQSSFRMKTGVFTTALCLILLVVLNALIYRKLYVSIVNVFCYSYFGKYFLILVRLLVSAWCVFFYSSITRKRYCMN